MAGVLTRSEGRTVAQRTDPAHPNSKSGVEKREYYETSYSCLLRLMYRSASEKGVRVLNVWRSELASVDDWSKQSPTVTPLPISSRRTMLIKSSHHDVQTAGGTTMRIFVFEPNMPDYPEAKWPGVVCFSGPFPALYHFLAMIELTGCLSLGEQRSTR